MSPDHPGRARSERDAGPQPPPPAPPFALETDLERRIAADPRWRAGLAWGRPRPGHPEGSVAAHVADVLANLDGAGHSPERRADLRIVALVHDAFKHEVDRGRPRSGDNHHGSRAARFLARHVDDPRLPGLVELHDEAYNAWRLGWRRGHWDRAEQRARRLLERLGDDVGLYLDFYAADNATAGKSREPLEWFARLAAQRPENAG